MDHLNNIPSCHQKPPRLTRDQEHVLIVSALRQVISNDRGDTSSSNSVAFEALHQPLDAGPCPLCSITGCYGCAFPVHEETEKDQKKHKGVRKKPSGKWSAEIWDPNLQRRKWLGTFTTAKMAAKAYDDAAADLVRRKAAAVNGTKNGEEPATTTVEEDEWKNFGRVSK